MAVKKSKKRASATRKASRRGRSTSKRRPARPARAARSRSKPSGPPLDKERERGVHIIFVARDRSIQQAPSRNELDIVAKNVGQANKTDVVVFAGKPWHLVNGKLRKHPEVHHDFPDTVLHLRTGIDSAVWWSETAFQITGIVQETPNALTAGYPFSEKPLAKQDMVDGEKLWVARSTVPVPTAFGQEYKITFDMAGEAIDPNMDCI